MGAAAADTATAAIAAQVAVLWCLVGCTPVLTLVLTLTCIDSGRPWSGRRAGLPVDLRPVPQLPHAHVASFFLSFFCALRASTLVMNATLSATFSATLSATLSATPSAALSATPSAKLSATTSALRDLRATRDARPRTSTPAAPPASEGVRRRTPAVVAAAVEQKRDTAADDSTAAQRRDAHKHSVTQQQRRSVGAPRT